MVKQSPFRVLTLLTLVSGCSSWVDLKPEGQDVRIARSSEVGSCKSIGHVISNTTDSLAGVPRDQATIEDELNRLSRNQAGHIGGDTIVPQGVTQNGVRTYAVYRCGKK